MKKIIGILISFIIIIISCQSPQKKETSTLEQSKKLIDSYVKETIAKGNINSIAIATYKNGNIHKSYFGPIDKGSQNFANDSTLYEIASISKVFLGSLVARAILEKKITLNDDIRIYLKGDYSNLEFEGTPIIIKNLLTHTLGFANKTPKGFDDFNKKARSGYYEDNPVIFDYNMNDFLTELKSSTLNKKPGTYYEYNSVGPELLAYILEQVYDKSYAVLLNDFFHELKMDHSYLNDYSAIRKHIANGYKGEQLMPLERNPLLGGTAGIVASLPDLIKFMKFQLESNDPLIKESTRKLFENDDDDKLGYLWDVDVAEEEGFYYVKSGTANGIESIMLICPDTNYGLILIVNNTSDKASNDWVNLYYKIESDLIKYPRLNLSSLLKEKFITDTDEAIKEYKESIKDTKKYYCNPGDLNQFGYQLFANNKPKGALKVFKLLVSEFPNNSNAHDSLGEAYFRNKDYKNALISYEKSLELNPNNENAKQYITKIKAL
mgnify:CR=1 FL=1